MLDWPAVNLGEVLTRVRRQEAVREGEVYPSVAVMKEGRGLGIKTPFIGGETNYKHLFRVEAGDVVVRTITAYESPVAVALPRHDGAFVSQVFLTYRVDGSRALPAYLALTFQLPSFWEQMSNRAQGTVLRRKTISNDAFLGIPLRLPTIRQQRQIVDLVAALDKHGDAVQVEIAALRDLYAAYLNSLGERFGRRTLEDLVLRATAGGTPSRERTDYFGGTIPWVKSGEVEHDAIASSAEFITEAGLKNSAAKWVRPGSTLVAMYGQGDTKGRAGFVVAPVTTNQAVLALTPNPEIVHDRYLLHAVRSRTESLRARAVGAAQPNLSKALVISEEVPLPDDLRVQQQEAQVLDSILDATMRSLDELRSISALRADLLAVLLSQDVEIADAYDTLLAEVG